MGQEGRERGERLTLAVEQAVLGVLHRDHRKVI